MGGNVYVNLSGALSDVSKTDGLNICGLANSFHKYRETHADSQQAPNNDIENRTYPRKRSEDSPTTVECAWGEQVGHHALKLVESYRPPGFVPGTESGACNTHARASCIACAPYCPRKRWRLTSDHGGCAQISFCELDWCRPT